MIKQRSISIKIDSVRDSAQSIIPSQNLRRRLHKLKKGSFPGFFEALGNPNQPAAR